MDVGKSQRVPLLVFFGIVRLFSKTFIFTKGSGPPLIRLMICDRMDEKSQSVAHGAPIRSNFWVFLVL